MKCVLCLEEFYKNTCKTASIKYGFFVNRSEIDRALIERHMAAKLAEVPDAVTALGRGAPFCLKHFIEEQL